jgi:hypothetical protein
MGWRGFGFVYRSRTLFCRAVPNPNITIRNFFIAVPHPKRKELHQEQREAWRYRINVRPFPLPARSLDGSSSPGSSRRTRTPLRLALPSRGELSALAGRVVSTHPARNLTAWGSVVKWAPCSTSGPSDYRAEESNNLKGKVRVERQLVGLPWAHRVG